MQQIGDTVLVVRLRGLGSWQTNWRPCAGLFVGLLGFACSEHVTIRVLPTSDPEMESNPSMNAGPSEPSAHDSGGSSVALSFYGPYDTVEIPNSELLDLPQDFAVELWVLVRSFNGGHALFNRWQLASGDIVLTFGTPEPLPDEQLPISAPAPSHDLSAWSLVDSTTWITAVAPEQPATNEWHHIAVSYGGGAFKLYVDGARVAEQAGDRLLPSPDGDAFIGATARTQLPIDAERGERWWPPIDGFIAEVRLSATDRYPEDFAPDVELTSDESTIALWKLDEGAGEVAFDSGPHALHGTIRGATWAPVPERR